MTETQMTSQQNRPRHQQILSELRELAASLLDVDASELDLERNFLELGADSLTLMDTARAIQESFGMTISVRLLLEEISNFANLAAYIDESLPSASEDKQPASEEASTRAEQGSGSSEAVGKPAQGAPAPPASKRLPEGEPPTPLTVSPPAVEQPVQDAAPSCRAGSSRPKAAAQAPSPAAQPAAGVQPASNSPDRDGTNLMAQVISQQFQFLAYQLDQQRHILEQQLAAVSGTGSSRLGLPSGNGPGQSLDAAAAPSDRFAGLEPEPPAGEPAEIQEASQSPAKPPAADAEAAGKRSAAEQGSKPSKPFLPYKPIRPGSAGNVNPRQQAHLEGLIERYTKRTGKSKAYARRFRPVFAENRASAGFHMTTKEMLYPIVAERSRGSRFWDLDGNEYIDLAMGFGVLLFGHSPKFIRQALTAQMQKGFQTGPQSELAGEVAERIGAMTGTERVAFCNTGSEAVMFGLRLARTATGRSKVVLFSGAFHGSNDVTLMRADRTNGDVKGIPIAPGIPRSMAEDVLVVDYGEPESLEIIRKHGNELAAVLVEPVQSRRPDLQPGAFLKELRQITARTGTALIFDEIITGFRIHPRGAQGWFDVQADLALYGKVLGGGLPIGVIAGASRFMDCYDGGLWDYGDTSYPRGLTSFFAGTFSKHPLAMAATSAVLGELEQQGPSLQEDLNRKTARLVDSLNDFFAAEGLGIRTHRFGSLFRFSSAESLHLLFYHLAEKGVYIWEGRTCFLSTAHTDSDVDAVLRAVQEGARQLKATGFLTEAAGSGTENRDLRPLSRQPGQLGKGEPTLAEASPNPVAQKAEAKRSGRIPGFSLYYFGSYPSPFNASKYDLLLQGARFADEHGFEAVWFPERHFHEVGGLSPNPSVLAAALARETKRIQLRAGSVVLPLHHPMRVAEEWSLVDNLSKGRVGVSFASGWHSNDFLFAPEAYGEHREIMFREIETVQRLWRGEAFEGLAGAGKRVQVRLHPMPMQKTLPMWLTAVGNPETYARAGAIDAGILTNLMQQSLEELSGNLDIYRSAREQNGLDPDEGRITVLIHTFVGDQLEAVREKAERPFCTYLKSFLGLARSWVKKHGFAVDLDHISEEDLDYLLSSSYKRYVESTALIGTPDSCAPIVDRLTSMGVSEIACFIDFGVNREAVVDSFEHLDALRKLFEKPAESKAPSPAPVQGGNGSGRPPADIVEPSAEAQARAGEAEQGPQPLRSFPLAEGQQEFWLFSQLSEEASSAAAESMVLRLKGPFQIEAMRSAMQQIVDRHEALRTTIDPGGELQYVWPTKPVDLSQVDFSERPEAEREEAVFQWLTDQKEPAFDLVGGPLWRCYVLRISEHDHLLVLTIHHLVVDGWSLALICRELSQLYPAACRGTAALLPTPMQYHEYVRWEEEQRTSPERAASESYWKRQFADAAPLMDLPGDRPRPRVATFRGAREARIVDHKLYQALKKLGAPHGATLFMVLLAAYAIFLKRMTGQHDLVIGSPSVRRSLKGSEGMVGFSLNMLAIRIGMAEDLTFLEHLADVKKVLLAAYEHGDCPIGVVTRNLDLPHDPSQPLFATVQFNLNPRIAMMEMGELNVDLVPRPISFTPFDLFLDGMEINGELRLDFLYNTGLFDSSTIERWMDELIVLLGSIAANPQGSCSTFELMTSAERQQVLEEWNRTEAEYPRDLCLHQLIEAQCRRTPEACAAAFESQRLSYSELNRRANQVAHHLQAMGVEAGTRVGVCLERSLDLIVGLLAVLKSGGAYLPLDPLYPRERLEFMLEDAEASVLLTQQSLRDRLSRHQSALFCLDEEDALRDRSDQNPECSASPQHLAYVIYTSGSTGKPKGVQIRHQGVVNLLLSMLRKPGLTSQDRLLAITSASFDISIVELFLPLVAGGRVEVVSRQVARDGVSLLKKLTASKATLMQATPATWRMLLEAGWPPDLPGKDRFKIVSGGEVLSRDLADQLLQRSASVWNLYAPSETTVYSTRCQVEAGEGPVSIGRPIENTRIYILDRCLQQVPIGVAGELAIGGDGVAHDYLKRPRLTAERFIPDPFSAQPGARLYRTGDLARLGSDGRIEFLGRLDRQIKVRGMRIELGEIEAVLAEHPDVEQAVVAVRDYGPNDKHLDAYVVGRPERQPANDELRAFLKRKLPDYMVPSWFVLLEQFPLTPNGKVDVRALPDPQRDRGELKEDLVAPSTQMEQTIARIWNQVLGLETLGVHDNFFDLGGHSLQGTQIISRLRELFAIDLTLTSLFQAPTIAAMAGLVADRQRALRPGSPQQAAPAQPPIHPRSRVQGAPPLSYAQQRLWLLNQLEPESPAYNLATALRLLGPLNTEALEGSLNEVVGRHESLRTLFVSREGKPVQVISPDSRLRLVEIDLRNRHGEEQEEEVRQLLADETRRPFDLARGPLLRVCLLCLDEQEHILLFTIHHITSDGWSNSIFVRELAAIYESSCQGLPSPLKPVPIQYADYGLWQRQWLKGEVLETQLAYWKDQLQDIPSVLELPTDHPRPAVKRFRGAYHTFRLPQGLVQGLRGLSREADATLFMTLLAAFQTLLYRYTEQEDIVVGSPVANRNRTETESLIGVLVNTLVLRTSLAGNPSFREVLARVRENVLEGHARQDLPFERLVEALQPERSLNYSPLFQVMFVLQNNPPAELKLAGLEVSQVEIERVTAKFDLTLSIEEEAQGLMAGLQYDTDLFEEATIERMAGHYLTLLRALAAHPDQPVATAPILTEPEQRQLLVDWNETKSGVEQPFIHQAFEAQAESTPEIPALVFEEQQILYRELNRRANQLANRLIGMGVGPESVVGLYTERSIEALTGILGVLKSGGAYLPIDRSCPKERIAFMLDDAGTAVLLAQRRLEGELPEHSAQVLHLDSAWEEFAQEPDSNPAVGLDPANLAYVIYTSGSTGQPKAVAVEHRQLANYVYGAIERLGLPSGASYAAVTTLAADLGHTMIFPALVLGGTLHIAAQEQAADPEAFAAFMRSQQIDCLKIVPSHLSMLLQARSSDEVFPRRRLVLGGEASSIGWVEKLHEQADGCTIFNHYGPSETTVGVLTYRAERGEATGARETLPLGRPLPNTQVYILDSRLQPQPIGVPGELHVGGTALARGYLNRPDASADCFIPNPFAASPGERLYRTGDRARYLPDGCLEFLGRADRQIKVRGYRVELEEIETALAAHPKVSQAAVLAWHESEASRPSRLAAYLVAAPEQEAPAVDTLRLFLKDKLPEYMLPSSFVFLPELPVTPNGKLDRNALPEPDRGRPRLEQTYVPPDTPLEKVLASIWSEVLEVDEVGVRDNFFDLGGHSLLATQVMARVFKVFQIELPLRRLFETPTVAGLRDALSEAGESENLQETARMLLELADLSEEDLELRLVEQTA